MADLGKFQRRPRILLGFLGYQVPPISSAQWSAKSRACYRQRIQAAQTKACVDGSSGSPVHQGRPSTTVATAPCLVAVTCEGRGGPPPSRTVAFDVVTQGKLWRTLAGFRQLSARGATRAFGAREDQASLATSPARYGGVLLKRAFLAREMVVLPTAPRGADRPPAAAGRDKERAL